MSTLKQSTLSTFTTKTGQHGQFYSLPKLARLGFPNLHRLPVSIRIVLESVLRNCDGKKVAEEHIQQLANWQPQSKRTDEIPFIVARVVLQDFTGVPLLADLAAMRNVARDVGQNPKKIEPLVPVDLVVDHSVMIDHFGTADSLRQNMEIEFQRNGERYQFMKWGMQAFDTFKVVPPGIGIVHQVNLEYLFRGVRSAVKPGQENENTVFYPDTLVGTDSHTTMINGVGVVGWGVGGIEAEAGMLGQPVYFLTPDVVGVELTNALREGITATDLVLAITELLRKKKVVGKFVEFYGPGAASLSVTDRATLANMAPEYGATMGFFPPDSKTVEFMRKTGRTAAEADLFEAYFDAQGMLGMPEPGAIDYSEVVTLDLDSVEPSLAGPKRPQDRVLLKNMKTQFNTLFSEPMTANGFGKDVAQLNTRYPTGLDKLSIGHGDVLLAAITSCTNTSNPGVMLAAGLLAKKAVEKGLKVQAHIKTSLGPGSRVVSDYLEKTGLQPYLDQLGFNVAAYGCTTCIGNAGDLLPEINDTILKNDVIGCAVLSGNRNFEARIHPNLKANFLASPPLVVAYALSGKANMDMTTEPIGTGNEGQPVYLRDIWPSNEEVNTLLPTALDPSTFVRLYSNFTEGHDLWNNVPAPEGQVYTWPGSTYIAKPPFFDDFAMQPTTVETIRGAKPLLMLGDSVTTDHISPAGSFKPTTPAGKYLQQHGVELKDFNSYGSRRGNHDVMIRGTFANVRVKNLMIPPDANGNRIEGGFTIKDGKQTTVYDAAMEYIAQGTPTIVLAGEEYGTGSSRDWAAKGTQLLGVKVVVARSYERIHRSNLVGMGVLPLQFLGTDSIQSLALDGSETYDVTGLTEDTPPQAELTLRITRANGDIQNVKVLSRIDTPIEVEYYKHRGILPYVLRELLSA
ncbi:MAG: aconitate hydratase AcnA [Gammaproteobacteria bacterium]|uniref:aconitate hydratase AcnA n=1 Tax=Limnobacter sp. TaxID=2003368 RepID=UPI001D78841D|nr:aconitate hydratase AcnA [Limnobacter sp.]MBU0783481.1 aconitate hydratase AcnA [Gammaproteobacteria bacterium]MBU0850701.1 aconitate hydratase AcnA [Gammaproteobacteria bacterium]MBU1267535.1 aconitate hydratase AcnA [Gammaproteobacteria bacterium]MBU1527553.1 aconitate hydratase AcnA [Gammaproteobacteria bacterium]MBU1780713.1 aconitate hydratase AcnA [Gammaproteobacteria bacterium]